MKINIVRDSGTAADFMQKVNNHLNVLEEGKWKVLDIKYAIYPEGSKPTTRCFETAIGEMSEPYNTIDVLREAMIIYE